ncbi:sensor domain-containing diguanylate cyclase [Arenimonas fontis]|uniref:diguanylate cyclase n=1 Tax=Arenimonas fontis TaxID=2608255 RepID=A0A5B2ZAP4_9GAMM|nr:sensor domain-containing diguanylate cyclase [Arenimonas fontis]KAA2285015.1 diguanylate cyclase [Arenimonas fontis]
MALAPRNLLERLRPRRAGLRLWLGLSYGLLALALVAALSSLVQRVAGQKLRGDIGLRLETNARTLADRFDEGLFERLNDVRALALLPGMDDPLRNEETLRDLFSLMQLNYPDYAWIGVADASGEVLVASRGLLEGRDVSDRPWFQSARREPHVGDLREAPMLAEVLPVPAGEPLRLIDVAAPIHDDHGVVVGVIAGRLSSSWAETMRQSLRQPMAERDPAEVFVLDRGRRVVLGPEAWRDQVLELPSARAAASGRHGSSLESWPDGKEYLVGYAPTMGRPTFESLGWTVLVRKDADLALAPVADLTRQIWLLSLAIALLFLLVASLVARVIGAPLRELAQAAQRIRAGEPGATFPPERGYREAWQLSEALRTLVEELTRHQADLTQLNRELEQRVRERTQELNEANAQLEVLAMTDALTGLANRRRFGDQLAREASRAAEIGKPLALICLDIDHFKSINDRHGHPAGDAVLRRIALLLEEQVRGNDLLARIGGEEFAVLAVDTPLGAAAQLGERLRAAVEAAGTISIGHASVTVTVSVGVAGFPIRAGDVLRAPERLLAAADDALYRAKRNGRNRVEVAAGT